MTAWLAAITLTLFAFTVPAQAQLATGRDYVLIEPPQPTDDPAKIEVTEFFSYACPHCNDLNPHIVRWAAKLPADVAFKRVPVGFNSPFYQLMARLYYTLEVIGELPRLDDAVFNAIHGKGLKLIDEKSILDWVTSQGVDAKKFSDAYNSFGVSSKVKRADQVAQASKIRGVPALVVDGRYLVVGQTVKTQADLLALTDKLIDKARSERKQKTK
jgi:thiol:disulfide interchange protein DsbA